MAKKPIIRYFDRGVWYDATVSDIGNLEDLNTIHKTTVVEAINDVVGGNINISGNLLERLNKLDKNISDIDDMISSGGLNQNQAEEMNQFIVDKLNELNQSMEELNEQREQRLKEQEANVVQLKLDVESDRQRISEIIGDLNTTKEKLSNTELNVTTVTDLVDDINGKILQAVSRTDFDLLEGTVREQKTLIDQTTEGIKLLATKEELDKTNGNVSSIKSELDVQAGVISSKVSSEQLINEIAKIDKYMPNLLRYTRNWQGWTNNDEANIDVTLNEYRDCIIQKVRGIGKGLSTTVEDLEIGETYSLSIWVKHDDVNTKLYAVVNNAEIVMTDLNSEETFLSNEFKRMRCSFVASENVETIKFMFKECRTNSYGYLAGAKCEKSKKVSGWQPHSEDVYQSIKSASSEIKQTNDKITTLVETVTKQGEAIGSNSSSITQTDKAIKLQAETINALNESMTTAKADLKVASDAISSKVWKTDVGEMIGNINIDNKNRVLNSDFVDKWDLWSETNNLFQFKKIGNYTFAVAERSGLSQNMAIAIATNKFPVKHNERLMFGFYFYCANLSQLDNKIVGALELLDINDVRIDRVDFDVTDLNLENGSFIKLSDTYFIEDERIVKARLRFFLNRNGNVGFALPMAQAGDIKSSDWSLAPEDIARRFNGTNIAITNYEQTVDGFRQTVESYQSSVDGYTNQVSEFNQNVNGFRQDITTYKDNLNGRIDQLQTSLNTESGRITAVVAESSKTKNDLATLTGENGRIAQLELTANGLKSTVASQSSSIQTIQADTTNAKQLANDALSKSQSAVTSATNASSTANSALTKATDATSVANSASQNANNAVASANTAVSTASQAKSNADKAIADVAALTKTVTTQSTRIDQTSNRIDQVASGVTEIGNVINSQQSGGMNLWRFTKDYDGSKYNKWGQIAMTNIYYKNWRPVTTIDGFGVQYITTAWDDLSQRVPVKPNTEYTLSAMVKLGNENSKVGFYLDNGTRLIILVDGQTQPVQATVNGLSATEYRRVSATFNTGNANYSYARFEPQENSTMYMYQPMFNEGKPKPWSPHPDDTQSQIDGINNNIANNYYAKTTVDSKLSTAVDGITASYNREITTRLGNYYDRSTIDNKLTIDGTGIASYVKSTQAQLNGLSVGGRNLARGTHGEYNAYEVTNVTSDFNYNGIYTKVYTDGLKIGDTVSYRCILRYTDIVVEDVKYQTNKGIVFLQGDGNVTVWSSGTFDNRPIAEKAVKISGSGEIEVKGQFTVTTDMLKNQYWNVRLRIDYVRSGKIERKCFKVEKGNMYTDWSPSPEDMATYEDAQNAQESANDGSAKADDALARISVAESTIQQLSNAIAMLVTDENGSSMMTQTSNGWTFNMGTINDSIENAINNIHSLTNSITQANNTISNLNKLANDLSKKTAYINMTTDENNSPCIELGKVGNAFKVRVTNTSVDFIEGSSKIAYLSNQALFIETAVIKSELQIGEKSGFIWKTRSNGNMGLRWFG